MALKPAQLESQLAAFASAADRANRPTSMLTIPALLMVAALLYMFWAYRGLSAERGIAVAKQGQSSQIMTLVSQIKAEKAKEVDLTKKYQAAPFLGSQVGDETWKLPERGLREAPTVSQISSAKIDNTSPILRSDVTVTVNNEDIGAILGAVDATLNHEQLKQLNVFVSQANLTPSGTGWRATLRFSVYEMR